jgi:hypothetical protein
MSHSRRARAENAGRLLDQYAVDRREHEQMFRRLESPRAPLPRGANPEGAVSPPAHHGTASSTANRFIVASCEYHCRVCSVTRSIPAERAPSAIHCPCAPDVWIYATPGPLPSESEEHAAA